jgi:uncharacterized protein with von Willebrand factor type A (vWA) domain
MISAQPPAADLAVRLARLGRTLRAHGLPTSLRDELDGADALRLVDQQDREEVRRTLRIALKIPREGFEAFDRLLAAFWNAEEIPAPPVAPPHPHGTAPAGVPLRWDAETRRLVPAGRDAAHGNEPGYSPEAILRRKPFDQVTGPRDRAAMERLLQRLARRLRARPGRRLVPTRGRGRPDLRASYRRALATSGELLRLARRAHALTEPRLVFLCDTSGSMDAHTRFLLTFALSVRRAIPGAEVFAFNTELHHLSPELAPGKLELTLDRLAAAVPDWSGGTRIGACLTAFVDRHLTRLVDARTTVVVLSDGLDRGDPAELAAAAAAIRRRARALIWLNPLLGDPRYQPLAAGMQAALPFVDHFGAAHDLPSLERVLPHLRNQSG